MKIFYAIKRLLDIFLKKILVFLFNLLSLIQSTQSLLQKKLSTIIKGVGSYESEHTENVKNVKALNNSLKYGVDVWTSDDLFIGNGGNQSLQNIDNYITPDAGPIECYYSQITYSREDSNSENSSKENSDCDEKEQQSEDMDVSESVSECNSSVTCTRTPQKRKSTDGAPKDLAKRRRGEIDEKSNLKSDTKTTDSAERSGDEKMFEGSTSQFKDSAVTEDDILQYGITIPLFEYSLTINIPKGTQISTQISDSHTGSKCRSEMDNEENKSPDKSPDLRLKNQDSNASDSTKVKIDSRYQKFCQQSENLEQKMAEGVEVNEERQSTVFPDSNTPVPLHESEVVMKGIPEMCCEDFESRVEISNQESNSTVLPLSNFQSDLVSDITSDALNSEAYSPAFENLHSSKNAESKTCTSPNTGENLCKRLENKTARTSESESNENETQDYHHCYEGEDSNIKSLNIDKTLDEIKSVADPQNESKTVPSDDLILNRFEQSCSIRGQCGSLEGYEILENELILGENVEITCESDQSNDCHEDEIDDKRDEVLDMDIEKVTAFIKDRREASESDDLIMNDFNEKSVQECSTNYLSHNCMLHELPSLIKADINTMLRLRKNPVRINLDEEEIEDEESEGSEDEESESFDEDDFTDFTDYTDDEDDYTDDEDDYTDDGEPRLDEDLGDGEPRLDEDLGDGEPRLDGWHKIKRLSRRR